MNLFSSLPVSIKARVGWVRMNKLRVVYWRIWYSWGPANWVALCVTELDDTLSPLMGVQWDSVQATHGVSAEAYTWKTALEWGRIRPDSLTVSWIIATRGALLACVCHIVRLFPLQGWLLIRISTTPSEMGDACSLHLNVVILLS
jgi:hypothetical protein